MLGSRKFCQRGSNSDVFLFFLVYVGREDQNNTKSGPPSARQQNAISIAFRWQADGDPTLNAIAVGFTGNQDQYC